MEKKSTGKYADKLKALIDNKSEIFVGNTDYDKLINLCAEISNDLHEIKNRLEVEIHTYKGYCKEYNKQSTEFYYWLGHKSHAESTFNMLKDL